MTLVCENGDKESQYTCDNLVIVGATTLVWCPWRGCDRKASNMREGPYGKDADHVCFAALFSYLILH